jgi:uncharacterized protein (DUF305 family)
MTPRTSLRTVSVVLLALIALLASASVGAQPGTPPAGHEAHHDGTPTSTGSMPGATMMPGSSGMGGMMQTGEFDLMFIDMMIQHHEGAVAMAQVAVERAEHPELARLAQTIIDDQQAEIDRLRGWRDAWYPGAAELSWDEMMGGWRQMMAGMPGMPAMGPMAAGMMGMMDPQAAAAALQGAAPFDLAFVDAMIPHHLGALMMAEMAVQRATHPELVAMAQAMFDTQTAEIAQMRAWRADWSGTAATPAS